MNLNRTSFSELDWPVGIILSVVSIGCAVAASGEIRFSVFGVITQAAAVVVSEVMDIPSCRIPVTPFSEVFSILG
jgi:hypothetical protein